MALIRRMISYPLVVASELPARFTNWYQIRIMRSHLKFNILGMLPNGKNIAILVVFPGTTTFGSVERISRWIEDAGYALILVINENPLAKQWSSKLTTNSRAIIMRKNIGADFGAYKLSLDLLKLQRSSIENLVIANDSMIYAPATENMVLKIIDINSLNRCDSVFLHKQGVIHAPSMLLKFNKDVLMDDAFWNFWRKYFPYSTKRKIIRKGEHRLTRILGWRNVTPAITTSDNLSANELNITEFLQLLRCTELGASGLLEILKVAWQYDEHLYLVNYAIENLHVSDSLGLYCARMFDAPLKLDLSKRGLTTKNAMLDVARSQGMSEEELIELKFILDSRKSYLSKNLFERIFS